MDCSPSVYNIRDETTRQTNRRDVSDAYVPWDDFKSLACRVKSILVTQVPAVASGGGTVFSTNRAAGIRTAEFCGVSFHVRVFL